MYTLKLARAVRLKVIVSSPGTMERKLCERCPEPPVVTVIMVTTRSARKGPEAHKFYWLQLYTWEQPSGMLLMSMRYKCRGTILNQILYLDRKNFDYASGFRPTLIDARILLRYFLYLDMRRRFPKVLNSRPKLSIQDRRQT